MPMLRFYPKDDGEYLNLDFIDGQNFKMGHKDFDDQRHNLVLCHRLATAAEDSASAMKYPHPGTSASAFDSPSFQSFNLAASSSSLSLSTTIKSTELFIG